MNKPINEVVKLRAVLCNLEIVFLIVKISRKVSHGCNFVGKYLKYLHLFKCFFELYYTALTNRTKTTTTQMSQQYISKFSI